MSLSLNKRLLISATLTLLVFLGLVFVALEQAFVSSVTRSEAEKLHSNILLLLAEAESTAAGLSMPDVLQEARFNQLDSGLYGFIFDAQGQEVWRSYSAVVLDELPNADGFTATAVGEDRFGATELGSDGFLYATMGINWQLDESYRANADAGRHYTLALLESADFFYGELESFRNSLLWRLMTVAAVLLVVQVLVLRLGLRPLKRLSGDLQRIESGELERLEGSYPLELQGLAENLNQLLEHEEQQRERHKNRLSDLAHSLKTPLSIVRGVIGELVAINAVPKEPVELLGDQVQNMDDIVQYQLRRANSASAALAQQSVLIAPVINRLLLVLEKVYADKNITVDQQLDEQASCKLDGGDLLELLGNVLENAFKYGNKNLSVSLLGGARGSVLCIADDGPGIPLAESERIFARGQRLDTQQPGQGIGLAVAKDILDNYGAAVALRQHPLGGACFEIEFPN